MEWLWNLDVWSALLTLTVLEIVLGIDNIIFLTLLVNKVPEYQRTMARRLGLLAAMATRIALLLSVAWLAHLVEPLFTVMGTEVSIRDLVLFFGGLFLIYKAVTEIHESLEGGDGNDGAQPKPSHVPNVLPMVILQIAVVDIVFSLDSVITAVGLVKQVAVMVAAIVLAIMVMMFAAKPIGDFVETHPTIKILALAFLVLVGAALMAEGAGHEMPKGYLYFAMAFAFLVEMLNLRLRKTTP